jgi:asparagine synthase (glutamine-hydrolysing)
MQFLNDKKFKWHNKKLDSCTVWYVGRISRLTELVNILKGSREDKISLLEQLLKEEYACYSCVVEGDGFIFATVDRIRSFPLFYTINNGSIVISNNARLIKEHVDLENSNSSGLLEFTMAGFITGNETAITGLYQLQSGEALLSNSTSNSFETIRYGQYFPKPIQETRTGEYLSNLEKVMDNVFNRMIEQANGAPIMLPLSGGLDSRLIACKLKELNYPRVETYSYGAPGNHEARIAEDVAKTLELPWRFVKSNTDEAQKLFSSNIRQDYWLFADGLCAQPPVSMLQSMILLKEQNAIPENAIFINGQSGDFITGGHIPEKLWLNSEPTEDILLDIILEKHFSLWKSYCTDKNLNEVRKRIRIMFESWGNGKITRDDLIALYEAWECQERQCKYVVNGQRLYDFLDVDWLLPHWDGEIIKFWERIPFEFKYEQKLYKEYLLRYDYLGLFSRKYIVPSTWPRSKQWIPWLARIKGLLMGTEAKETFYQKMFYYGVYHNQYAFMGIDYYLRNYRDASGVVSFLVDHWLKENKYQRPVNDES